ncbi:hypothetical protein [Thalassotalea sp. ND16A]|uniref:hypothetical protein n=1 Tax=Thalassotalea sp. ND16A TaxID=1535422 RepID=UPI00051A634B|nr:hypothetical protein [Thalassotalea sp. ND16A]KGJ87894.1 hypothetical protein ND16A_2808 [Thalassotalea sp. ND16A]
MNEHIMNEPIAIIGAGWLGLPLAKYLKQIGHSVVVTSTTALGVEKLAAQQLHACLFNLPEVEHGSEVFHCQTLIICIPPGIRYGKSDYPEKIAAIIKQAEQSTSMVESIMLLSSSAVYNGLQGPVNEDSALNLKAEKVAILHKAEQLISASNIPHKTVLRLAGLVGYDRQPGRFFKNGKAIANPDSVINLIHRDDVVAIIASVLSQQQQNTVGSDQVYNCVAPKHPTRRQFYQKAIAALTQPSAVFSEQCELNGKLIESIYFEKLHYQFHYPDMMTWLDKVEPDSTLEGK